MQSLISDGNMVSSSLTTSDDDDIPAAVLAMAKGGGGSSKASDMLKLQQMQDRLKHSKDSFESGENRGGKGS